MYSIVKICEKLKRKKYILWNWTGGFWPNICFHQYHHSSGFVVIVNRRSNKPIYYFLKYNYEAWSFQPLFFFLSWIGTVFVGVGVVGVGVWVLGEWAELIAFPITPLCICQCEKVIIIFDLIVARVGEVHLFLYLLGRVFFVRVQKLICWYCCLSMWILSVAPAVENRNLLHC